MTQPLTFTTPFLHLFYRWTRFQWTLASDVGLRSADQSFGCCGVVNDDYAYGPSD